MLHRNRSFLRLEFNGLSGRSPDHQVEGDVCTRFVWIEDREGGIGIGIRETFQSRVLEKRARKEEQLFAHKSEMFRG